MTQRELNLERLMTTGAIAGLDVSPDGTFICFGSTVGGVSQVFVQPLDGGDEVQITHGTEAATQPKWSPRGDLIAYLQDIGGDENYQVYVVDPQGGEARDVTQAPGKLHENFAWSWDGTRVTYVSNRDGHFDVYYSDVDTGQVHRVTNYPAVHHAPEFNPDGTMIAFGSNRSEYANNWDTFTVNLTGGEEHKISQHEGEADEMSYYAGQSPHWSPDGCRILIASAVPGNYDIMAADIETREQEWLANSKWDESNGQWSPDGSHVAYVVNDDGNLIIHVKNLHDGQSWPVSPVEGVSGYTGMRGKGGSYRWTPDGKQIVYSYSGPAEAGSIWVVPAQGGEARCLYSTMPADVPREALIHPSIIHYQSFDGRQISAILYRPHQAEESGLGIVMPHGGPTGQSMNGWNPVIQYLASRGYTIIFPNFRGSTGYGSEFQWLNRYDWGGGDLKDVVAAAEWLESQGIADKIGITGGSYGGYMTMSAVTKYPQRWAAAVAIFPMVDLKSSYTAAREDMRQFQIRNMGTLEENPELYYDRSPINFVEQIACPVLILQGDRDARCRVEEVVAMGERMKAAGTVYELVIYEHEGHGFAKLENRLDSYRRLSDFFDRHLAKTGEAASASPGARASVQGSR